MHTKQPKYIYMYVLENGEPRPAKDALEWARWFEAVEPSKERQIAFTKIGVAEVSTVFLGVNHNFLGKGLPILWETMVFGGPFDQEQQRYSSKKAALAGHAAMCKMVEIGSRKPVLIEIDLLPDDPEDYEPLAEE